MERIRRRRKGESADAHVLRTPDVGERRHGPDRMCSPPLRRGEGVRSTLRSRGCADVESDSEPPRHPRPFEGGASEAFPGLPDLPNRCPPAPTIASRAVAGFSGRRSHNERTTEETTALSDRFRSFRQMRRMVFRDVRFGSSRTKSAALTPSLCAFSMRLANASRSIGSSSCDRISSSSGYVGISCVTRASQQNST